MEATGRFDWNALFIEPLRQNGEKIATFLPHLMNAVYILAFGWLLAYVSQVIVRKFLAFFAFDKIAEKSGIASALNESGVAVRPGEWFSRLFFWFVMATFIVKALQELSVSDLAGNVDLFAGFIFQSAGLLAIFIVGLFLSVVLSKIVFVTATNLKVKSPLAYGRTMKWTILVFTILLVLKQITIPLNFVFMVAGAVFVSMCLAFIIAFGVGGRGWAAKILERISK